MEETLERQRRAQEKESAATLNGAMDKITAALNQMRTTISADTKGEIRANMNVYVFAFIY